MGGTKGFSLTGAYSLYGKVGRRSATASVLGGLQAEEVGEVVGGLGSIELTRIEFDLLSWFAASPRQVFTKAVLLSNVWGCDSDWLNEATVTEHVRRVRKKLEAGTGRRWIATVWGVGYRFEPPSKIVDRVAEDDLLVAIDR